MPKSRFAAALGAALVAVGAGLFAAAPADARVIYIGTYDPRGDVYGFSGTYKFAVDPACLATDGLKSVNSLGSCGDVVLIGGSLTLRKYDAPGPDNATPILEHTFDFSEAQNDWDAGLVWGTNPGEVGGMKDYISSINVVDHKLYGVDTPARFGAFGLFDNLYWGLQFQSGGQPDEVRGVTLLVNCQAPFTPFQATCDGPNGDSSFVLPAATNVTLTQVPEPGMLALVAAALAGLGLAGRRRRG